MPTSTVTVARESDHTAIVYPSACCNSIGTVVHSPHSSGRLDDRTSVASDIVSVSRSSLLEGTLEPIRPYLGTYRIPRHRGIRGRHGDPCARTTPRPDEASGTPRTYFCTSAALSRGAPTPPGSSHTYIEYARYADDLVILVDNDRRQDWLVEAVDRRLREELAKLDVRLNEEK